MDTKAHSGDTQQAIRLVREWLSTVSKRKTIPSLLILRNAFLDFENKLPIVAGEIGYETDQIPFNDFCRIVEKAIAQNIQ